MAGIVVLVLAACVRAPGSASGGTGGGGMGAVIVCDSDNGGITLPAGFCATVFADQLGVGRHVEVAANGDVFVALRAASAGKTGGIVALRDTTRDGKADVQVYFGEAGGTGIKLHNGYIYHDARTAIVRYPMPAGALQPSGPPDTIVADLPTGGHGARNFVIDANGALYVNVGSFSNSCQVENRVKESPGVDPCVELETRAGIWKFDANRKGQRQSDGERYATGIRNAVALTLNSRDGRIYVAQHGRDQLYQNWPQLYDSVQSAEKPAEELQRLSSGSNFGWPYCFYDPQLAKRVLAPEYAGDGKGAVGRCASFEVPVAAFPGHWAPNALVFYSGDMFPSRYKDGAFIAFHGSWNRAPLPQQGFKVVFVPFSGGNASGNYETFADGFTGGRMSRDSAAHRPTGLAVGPGGALYISDSKVGRIWRVVFRG
ncbi:MAG: sorbosone dehydrogenase family protein [Gemmatimonadaceae bacterium]